ncbi:hypothetical protein, unlikely [Trypanosoma brucei brucei TREU927]|uniref:Uncharacterized protein n=1 Tax=Trypanosoma brucei brucei (strain 927/4 GUTat10.1) TaxID=185431 RepID=Q4GZ69_TRYB2|nr:hypothetical protein, unlikely [Trypanosoma brucei brucei TREU927]CAJ16127.1 hypothetical protein, unlikely [Trypanosoma brucei brucei TREU927]
MELSRTRSATKGIGQGGMQLTNISNGNYLSMSHPTLPFTYVTHACKQTQIHKIRSYAYLRNFMHDNISHFHYLPPLSLFYCWFNNNNIYIYSHPLRFAFYFCLSFKCTQTHSLFPSRSIALLHTNTHM